MQTLREAAKKRSMELFSVDGPAECLWDALDDLDLLDLPILDGVGLVAMDRDAGACQVRGTIESILPVPFHQSWDQLTDLEKSGFLVSLKHILTACIPAIIVPDEVVECRLDSPDGKTCFFKGLEKAENLRPGATLEWDMDGLGYTITITVHPLENP